MVTKTKTLPHRRSHHIPLNTFLLWGEKIQKKCLDLIARCAKNQLSFKYTTVDMLCIQYPIWFRPAKKKTTSSFLRLLPDSALKKEKNNMDGKTLAIQHDAKGYHLRIQYWEGPFFIMRFSVSITWFWLPFPSLKLHSYSSFDPVFLGGTCSHILKMFMKLMMEKIRIIHLVFWVTFKCMTDCRMMKSWAKSHS